MRVAGDDSPVTRLLVTPVTCRHALHDLAGDSEWERSCSSNSERSNRRPLVLAKVWKYKLDHICPLPLAACSVLRQFFEKQPVVRVELPERQLRGTVACFERSLLTRVGFFATRRSP